MKWDIDRAMAVYEPDSIPGTLWQRTLLSAALARKEGIVLPPDKADNDSVLVWSLGIGQMAEPKEIFVHALTMRACFLRLRMLVKSKRLKLDPQLFPKLGIKPKPKNRRRQKKPEKKESGT
jgi:hypothetical protein